MSEVNALERVLAIRFAESCPLPPGKRDELAELLATYRQRLRAGWDDERAYWEKRGIR